jgi:TonB family protein
MLFGLLICAALLGGTISSPSSGALLPKAAVAPKYPPLAALASVSGTVVVRATIDESGGVLRADVLSGHDLLRGAAAEAARKWKFEPAAVQTRTSTIRFRFVLLGQKDESDLQITFFPPDIIELKFTPTKPPVNYGADH